MKSFDSLFNNKNYQVNWYPKDKDTFRYAVIDNIFKKSFHIELQDFFKNEISQVMGKFDHYDCNYHTINPRINSPFDFLFSHEWKNFISNIFPDIPLTYNTVAEIQHHEIGSPSGWVHNDFDASLFLHEPLENGINAWYHNSTYRIEEPNYDDGFITDVRSIAMIYHINDKPDWEEGDGGETAFYDSFTEDINNHFLKINPTPNRLVVYEINPFSQHNFKSNIKHQRTTFTQWYHTSMEDTTRRYTEHVGQLYKEPVDGYELQKRLKQ